MSVHCPRPPLISSSPLVLQISDSPPTPLDKPLRLPVTDVVKTRAGALALGGKLEAGALRAGSRVVLVPGGQEVGTVKALDVDGQVRVCVCVCYGGIIIRNEHHKTDIG